MILHHPTSRVVSAPLATSTFGQLLSKQPASRFRRPDQLVDFHQWQMVFACSERAVFYECFLRNSVGHYESSIYARCHRSTFSPFFFFSSRSFLFFLFFSFFFFFFFLLVTSEGISPLNSEQREKFFSPRARRVFSIFPFFISDVR